MRLVKLDSRPLVSVRLFSSAISAADIYVYDSAIRLVQGDSNYDLQTLFLIT
jgi:hypothetical protein